MILLPKPGSICLLLFPTTIYIFVIFVTEKEIKSGFFSESEIRFSNLPISQKIIPKNFAGSLPFVFFLYYSIV